MNDSFEKLENSMDERAKHVLFAVVESYINKPEPVGSRFVTKKYPIGFSPATIRNIMADLEEMGFLGQPHTSAGRIPTDKGYRFYVNCLYEKKIRPLPAKQDTEQSVYNGEDICEFISSFSKKLKRVKNDINTMFLEVTNTLSMMSNYVGIALLPKPENTTFNRIDLIKYKGDNIVAILVTDEGVIRNRILKVDSKLTQHDLNRISDYLNSEYSGLKLDEIRGILINRMKQEKVLWDRLISKAIKICEEAISFTGDNLFISGLHDVINLPDFSDISKIKEMARAIKDKHLILKLLDELSKSEGVQVLIGSENQFEELKNMSIVASPYKERNRPMGVIALIGPTRMNYSKAIYMVDSIAKCISKIFE